LAFIFFELEKVFFSIVKAHVFIIIILFITFLLEKVFGLSLFIDQFKWKKSTNNARIHLNRDTFTYFVFTMGVFIYDIIKGNVTFHIIPIAIWLVIMIILTIIFRDLYDKYQGYDPKQSR
jgi:hypothetical protein